MRHLLPSYSYRRRGLLGGWASRILEGGINGIGFVDDNAMRPMRNVTANVEGLFHSAKRIPSMEVSSQPANSSQGAFPPVQAKTTDLTTKLPTVRDIPFRFSNAPSIRRQTWSGVGTFVLPTAVRTSPHLTIKHHPPIHQSSRDASLSIVVIKENNHIHFPALRFIMNIASYSAIKPIHARSCQFKAHTDPRPPHP